MGLLDGILGGTTGATQMVPDGGERGGGKRVLMALLPVVLGMLRNRQGSTPAGGGGAGELGGSIALRRMAGRPTSMNWSAVWPTSRGSSAGEVAA